MHALLVWFALVSIGPAAGAPADGTPVVLTPGVSIERVLSSGQVAPYAISLERGQFAKVVVEQRGLDVVVTSLDPSGAEILRMDRPNGSRGNETISLVAERAGIFGIRVTTLYTDVVSGRYSIRIAELRPSAPNDRERLAAERDLVEGQRIQELGRFADANALYDDAVVRYGKIGDRSEQVVALFLAAIGRALATDYARAVELYARGRETARLAGDRQMEARIAARWGFLIANSGRPAEALEMLEPAIAQADAIEDRETEIEALQNAGYSAYLLGRYQKALECFQRALPLAREARLPTSEAWAHFGFGFTYWALSEPEKSIRSYEESLRIWRALKSLAGEAVALQGLSLSYWSIGASQKAYDAVVQTLPVVRALHDTRGEALALCNLGVAEMGLGRTAIALGHYREANAIWKRVGDPRQAFAISGVALALDTGGEHAEAGETWSEALSVAKRFGNRPVEAGVLANLARSEFARQDLASARRHAEESIALVETIRGEVSSESLRSSFLAAKQDAYAVLVDVLLELDRQQPGAGFAALAFAAGERGRVRGLVEGIAEAHLDLTQELPPELRRREQELEARIRTLRGESGRREASAPDDDRLTQAEEEWDRLVSEMRLRTPRYASLVYPEPASAEKTAAALGRESALVSYSLTDDRVVVFILGKAGVTALRLAVRPRDLAERVENYVGLIARGSSDASRELGRRLYAELVEPWRSRLGAKVRAVVLVPDGALNSLPFESLPAPGAARRYLGQDLTISYAPSATVLTALATPSRTKPPGGAAALLVLADPSVPRALLRSNGELEGQRFETGPLESARNEAHAVFRHGGPGSELRTGAQASERFMRSAPLDRFGVIHFATHALLDERVPARSALVLAEAEDSKDDGLLPAREIYRLRLSSELVVLSACQTARGRVLPGEGVQGLSQAFFHAGTRSVVASLWDVSDRRTADLMSRFYDHLAGGESKAAALQAAKSDLLEREPDLSPRYWAPFVLIGEPDGTIPLPPASGPRAAMWTAAAAAGLVLWRVSKSRRRRISARS